MSAAINHARVDASAITAAAVEPIASDENVKPEATLKLESSSANGMTPLMHAVCDDSVDVVRALLDCRAEVNAKRKDGFTALALAAFFGRTRIVELLLERGADVRAVTRFDTSPEIWANARGFQEIVDLLQDVPGTAVTPAEHSAIPEEDLAVIPHDDPVVESAKEKPSFADPPLTAPRPLPEIKDPPPMIGPAFHPGRAFIARISSDRRSLAALTVALIVALGLAIFAIYQFRSLLRDDARQTASTDNNLVVQPQAEIAQPDKTESVPQQFAPQETAGNQVVTADLTNKAAPGPSDESTTPATVVKPSIKILPQSRLSHSSVSTLKRDRATRSERPKQPAEPEPDVKPAPLTVEVSQDRTSPVPATRTPEPPPVQSAPLGITPSKPRTKVIQWP